MDDPAMTSTLPPPRFLFITCQVGAEAAVKEEIARRWPDFHIGYARPGFLTYKLPEGKYLTPDFRLGSVLRGPTVFRLAMHRRMILPSRHRRLGNCWAIAR